MGQLRAKGALGNRHFWKGCVRGGHLLLLSLRVFVRVIAVLGFPVCRDIMMLRGVHENALLLKAF